MADQAKLSLKDYDGENSSTTFNITAITAANHDSLVAELGALRVAAEAIMLQGWFGSALLENVYSAAPVVSDQFSQRESKWAIIVTDNLGNTYKANEIPCADLSILEGGSKYIYRNGQTAVVTAAAAVAAFVAAFEAFARTPSGGTMTVRDIYQVGRNI